MTNNSIFVGASLADSSVAVASSPFGAYNRRVSGFGLCLRSNPSLPLRTSDTRKTLSEMSTVALRKSFLNINTYASIQVNKEGWRWPIRELHYQLMLKSTRNIKNYCDKKGSLFPNK